MRVLSGGRLTSTGPVRHQHVAVEAVALVTPICVHAPVFTRPRLQPTLIQICRQRERERDSVSGLEDREIDTHRGEISQRAKVKRSIMFNLAHPFTCGFEFSVHLCPR